MIVIKVLYASRLCVYKNTSAAVDYSFQRSFTPGYKFCSALMFAKVHIWEHKIPKSLVKPDACAVNTFAPQHFEARYRRRIFCYCSSSCTLHMSNPASPFACLYDSVYYGLRFFFFFFFLVG